MAGRRCDVIDEELVGNNDVKELLLQAENQVNRHVSRTVNNGNKDEDLNSEYRLAVRNHTVWCRGGLLESPRSGDGISVCKRPTAH